MKSSLLLDDDELHELTGYRQPTKQVDQLRQMRIPFYTNAAGHPKVVRAILEGKKSAESTPKAWSPSWAVNQR